MHIDGAEFSFVERQSEDATYPRVLRWIGRANPLAFQIGVGLPDDFPLAAPLIENIQSIHIDRDALAKDKAQAETEIDGAVLHDYQLVTPLGKIAMRADPDTYFHLMASLTINDATGRPIFRRRAFAFLGQSYMSADSRMPASYQLDIGCGKQGAVEDNDAGRFIAMSDEAASKNPKRQFSDIAARPPETLLGLPAQVAVAHTGASGTDLARYGRVQRWLAKDGDTWFMIAATHFNARPIEKRILQQLAAGPAVCHYDLTGGPVAAPAQ